MGVSKQDWKNFQSQVWLGSCKPGHDALMLAFDGLMGAIDGGDAPQFLAYSEDNGNLMIAAQIAADSATDALHAIRELRLEGSQRRFANKSAIGASDDAINSVDGYMYATDILVTGLVRGLRTEHDSVEEDPANMPQIKQSDLPRKLSDSRSQISSIFDAANASVSALGAIDKIGVV